MSIRRARFAAMAMAALLCALSATAAFASAAAPDAELQYQQDLPAVRAILFWSDSCPHCHYVIDSVLPSIKEHYREQLNLLLIEMKSETDWQLLSHTASQYGIPQNQVGVPLLVIGDTALIGSGDIPTYLPGLIDTHLASGGLDWPNIPGLDRGVLFTLPGEATCDTGLDCSEKSTVAGSTKAEGHNLAIAVMGGMGISLAYVGVNAFRHFRKRSILAAPRWAGKLTPWLAVTGLVVAGYMAYVETQAVDAICGPVGDCNAVQSSSYARLFGVLPIGVLGVIGYLGILAAWFGARWWRDNTGRRAQQAVLVMTVFGTLFSLYLTYLEPFVIKAVCAWCLTSAVIITLLMLANVAPALQTARVKARW
ncbi:MAG TPA: vitamin K epoxide reductase family protein [Bellilinea sp.]|nr:vitamin K epoxide reductase family protein [Bellilinea sp.]